MSADRGSSTVQRTNAAPAGNQAMRVTRDAQANPEKLVFDFTDRDVSELHAVALFFRQTGRILKSNQAEEMARAVQSYLTGELPALVAVPFGLNDVGALLSWRKFKTEMPASMFQYCKELAGRLFVVLTGDPLPPMEGR